MTDETIGSFVSQQADAALLQVSLWTCLSGFHEKYEISSCCTGKGNRQEALGRTRSRTSCWDSFWNKGGFLLHVCIISLFFFSNVSHILRTISVYQICHQRLVCLCTLSVMETTFKPHSFQDLVYLRYPRS